MSVAPFHILLVEDNAADVYLFRKALQGADFHFDLTVICDGAEAIAFVQREGKYAESAVPDLAVIDLSLPKSDGSEVLAALRDSSQFADLPVVICSSSTSPQDRMKVERLGIERYLQKPPELENFLKIGGILKQILIENKARRANLAG